MRAAALVVVVLAGCGGDAVREAKKTHDMSLRAFLVTMPDEAKTLTLDCDLSTEYIRPEMRGDFWSIRMEEGKDRVWGYVQKDSALGRFIFDVVQDGKTHKFTVKVQRFIPDYAQGVMILDARH